MWSAYAALAAVFSALVAILSKLGLQGINSHYATAIRTSFVMVVAWAFVWLVVPKGQALLLTGRNWLFLFLSAVATGAAWLCYNRALQDGPATQVTAVDKLSLVLVAIVSWLVFGEKFNAMSIAGVFVILAGTFMVVYS